MAKRYTLRGLPRPPTLGKILPGAGRNVTVGDKVGDRWHRVSDDGEGKDAKNKTHTIREADHGTLWIWQKRKR